jgi:hypothetical protein
MPTNHPKKQSLAHEWGPLLFLLILVLLSGLAIRDWWNPFNDMEFSKAEWKNRQWEERAPMVESLIEKHLKPGMSRGAIEELLGIPDDEDFSGRFGWSRKVPVEKLIYEIGSWSLRGQDDNFLEVYLDSSGNMTRAQIGGF